VTTPPAHPKISHITHVDNRRSIVAADQIVSGVTRPPRLVQDAAATHNAAFRREPATLGLVEAQATAAELLAQDAVLLLKVLEDLALPAVHPAREHQEQELKRRGRQARPSYTRGPKIDRCHPGVLSRKA
jgi:hypothetical protein